MVVVVTADDTGSWINTRDAKLHMWPSLLLHMPGIVLLDDQQGAGRPVLPWLILSNNILYNIAYLRYSGYACIIF